MTTATAAPVAIDPAPRHPAPTRPSPPQEPCLEPAPPVRLAVNIVLGVVALFWLVPSLSDADHLVPPGGALRDIGLVEGLHRPLAAHPPELQGALHRRVLHGARGGVPSGFAPGGVLDSLRTSLEITIPATILVTADLQPRRLLPRVRPVAGPQRRLPDRSSA